MSKLDEDIIDLEVGLAMGDVHTIYVVPLRTVRKGEVRLEHDGRNLNFIVGTEPLTDIEQWCKDTIYDVFHSGTMLKWYEYIGEL